MSCPHADRPAAAHPARTLRRRRRGVSLAARCVLAMVAALAYTAFITWPHVLHLDSTILGPGDNQGGIRALWALHAQHGNPFTSARDVFVNAPEGVPLARAINLGNFIWVGAAWVLGLLFGFIAGFNLYALIAFVLAAPAMYLLLEWLGLGAAAAAFGAFVFTFNPNHVEHLEGAAPLAATWILPAIVLLLLHHRSARRRTTGLAAGLGASAAFYLDSYLGLLALVVAVVFFAVDVGLSARRLNAIMSYYWAAVALVVGMTPAAVGLAIDPGSAQSLAQSRVGVLPGSSATPQLFLLPGPRNPWLGGPMRSWLSGHLAWEGTMFIGYTTMALAVIGVVLAFRRRSAVSLGEREQFLVVFMLVLAGASLCMSLPSTVHLGPITIPAPQDIVRHFSTVYRVFARFGIVFDMCIVVLAAYALRRLETGRVAILVPVAALLVVAFELYVPRPVPVTVASWRTPVSPRQIAEVQSNRPHILEAKTAPPYVEDLRRLPPGIVANYPDPAAPDGRWSWKDEYYQTLHGHPLWDAQPGTPVEDAGLRDIAADLGQPGVPGILAAAHVRYVVVHTSRYRTLGLAPPRPSCGLSLIGRHASGGRLFRVTASPSPLFVTKGSLLPVYNARLWPENEGYRWMGFSDKIAVFSSHAMMIRIAGDAISFNQPRTLTLSTPNATQLSVPISTSFTKFEYTLHVDKGETELVLRSEPGPQFRGSGDPRSVSVAIASLTATPIARLGGAQPKRCSA